MGRLQRFCGHGVQLRSSHLAFVGVTVATGPACHVATQAAHTLMDNALEPASQCTHFAGYDGGGSGFRSERRRLTRLRKADEIRDALGAVTRRSGELWIDDGLDLGWSGLDPVWRLIDVKLWGGPRPRGCGRAHYRGACSLLQRIELVPGRFDLQDDNRSE